MPEERDGLDRLGQGGEQVPFHAADVGFSPPRLVSFKEVLQFVKPPPIPRLEREPHVGQSQQLACLLMTGHQLCIRRFEH